jgi:hypothetical protein
MDSGENLHLDHWIKLYHKKGTSIIEWLDVRSVYNDDIETSHTANTNLLFLDQSLKVCIPVFASSCSPATGGHWLFSTCDSTMVPLLKLWGKLPSSFLSRSGTWLNHEEWKPQSKKWTTCPLVQFIYSFICQAAAFLFDGKLSWYWYIHSYQTWKDLFTLPVLFIISATALLNITWMLIILPVLWNLSLEIIGTLKLVLGNHYTGSRFCYWYLLWSSTFGYWILIRIGVLAKGEFLFWNILYMIYHMMSKRQFHFFK